MLVPYVPEPSQRRLALRQAELFRGLDEAAIAEIDASSEWLFLHADALLFQAGEPGDAVYVVMEGRLEAWAGGPGRETLLGRIYPGQPVGEMALLADRPRSATIRAARDTVLMRLSREAFEKLAARDPHLLLALSRVLVERSDRKPARAERRAFAVVAASPNAPIEAFARALAAALDLSGRDAVVTAASVDAAVGQGAAQAEPGHEGRDRSAQWLDALERERSHVVLLADTDDTVWTRRCVQHADVVLLVADADDPPRAAPRHAAPPRDGVVDRRELVLVHPDSAGRPRSTRRWLDALGVERWHHVRLGRPGDVPRVGRFLTGRALGLAFSGGGARGFAHLGVLRALRELGIEIDLVCGTSMGAFIAGLSALGLDDVRVSDEVRRTMSDRSPIDYRIPLLSLARGRRIDETLDEAFGDRDVEDTWLRFFCVSCSLTRAAAVVHRRGPLARAIRGSSALPGVLPPLQENGDLLVDGVFLDNLPAELAQLDAGRAIAVNVLPPTGSAEWAALARDDGPVFQLARLLHPKTEVRLPPILQLAIQSIFLGTMQASARIARSVDVFIEPPVGKFWFLDFKAFPELSQIGYESAWKELTAWQARTRDGKPGAP